MDIHQGHILTAHCKDTPNGIEITYYGVSQANAFKLSFPQQKFVFFIPSDAHFSPQNISFERKKSKLLSFDKKSVDIIYLKFLKDIQTIKDYCEQNSLRTYEIDIPLEERFLMERFIYAQVEFTGKFTNENNLLTLTFSGKTPLDYKIHKLNVKLQPVWQMHLSNGNKLHNVRSLSIPNNQKVVEVDLQIYDSAVHT